jgi:hypothetical protein
VPNGRTTCTDRAAITARNLNVPRPGPPRPRPDARSSAVTADAIAAANALQESKGYRRVSRALSLAATHFEIVAHVDRRPAGNIANPMPARATSDDVMRDTMSVASIRACA